MKTDLKLPNIENAVLDIEKLTEYCLSNEHYIGKHKAKVFKNRLNITVDDSFELKRKILENLENYETHKTFSDFFGTRYFVDIEIRKLDKSGIVRTHWIIKVNENFPRFVSCYVKTN